MRRHAHSRKFLQAIMPKRDEQRKLLSGSLSGRIASFGLRGLSILVCHLPKSAKQMLIVKFANLEIGSAAERYRTSMAKYLPKPLRTLYRGGRAWAVNGVTAAMPPPQRNQKAALRKE